MNRGGGAFALILAALIAGTSFVYAEEPSTDPILTEPVPVAEPVSPAPQEATPEEPLSPVLELSETTSMLEEPASSLVLPGTPPPSAPTFDTLALDAENPFFAYYQEFETNARHLTLTGTLNGEPISGAPITVELGTNQAFRFTLATNTPASYAPYQNIPLVFDDVFAGAPHRIISFHKGIPGEAESIVSGALINGTSIEFSTTLSEPGHYFALIVMNYPNGWPVPGMIEALCGGVFDQNCILPFFNTLKFQRFLNTGIANQGGAAGEGETQPLIYGMLEFDVVEETPEPTCCSSVLFLPGIKGSVLKSGEDTLWPTDFSGTDIERLALSETGESIEPVVVDGILNTFIATPVYSGFSSFMDTLATVDDATGTSTVREWIPFAYDWRYAPDKILTDGVSTPSGVVDLIQTVETLAADSYTDKVTIVAHSMGGLLGKALIKELQNQGKEELIDNFVMVGTPQLGTPQGVASLLHGDDESIFGGFLVDASDVRTVGQNMESAYNLLPSPQYFAAVNDPIFTFSTTSSFTEPWRAIWGDEIGNYVDYVQFLTGLGVSRTDPAPEDLLTPEILRADIVGSAATFHGLYDSYAIPENIRVVQVAGWGLPTVKTIEYVSEHSVPGYRVVPTVEGDKTVVYPSAVSSVSDKYYLNLASFNRIKSEDAQHKDLLSVEPVQFLITKLLKSESISEIEYISSLKPPITEVATQLLVVTRSPVILGVRDAQGNFTGVDPNQDLASKFLKSTEDIPGSSFFSSGGDQYIFLPKEGSYTFEFKGTGDGPATVETATFVNDIVTPIATYTDIPVTPDTEATFVIDTEAPEDTHIQVDFNGDGTIDASIVPDGTVVPPPTLSELITSLKMKIQSLDVKPKLKEKLLKKVEKLEKKIEKQKNIRASKVVMNLEKKVIKKTEKGKISDSDAEAILDLLNAIQDAL